MNTDNENNYEVRKYFDDHFEGVVGRDLTKSEAYALIDKLEKGGRAYVSYSVVKTPAAA